MRKLTSGMKNLIEECNKLIPMMTNRELGLIGLTLMEANDRLMKERYVEEK